MSYTIRETVQWTNARCRDDTRCIAQHDHEGDHRDLSKTWTREDDPTPNDLESSIGVV